MYMIGLMPYGFAKLFSMFLYASHRHSKAAKIATIALLGNIIASLLLMKPLGAMGLALAGSIGGWILFILTIKEVGFKRFIEIIKSKNSLYFITIMIFLGTTFFYLNKFILVFIRG